MIGLSPLRGKYYLAGEKSIASDYADSVLSCERGITTRDYNDVKRCDLIVVNFLGVKEKVSIGTVMEIAWAKAFQIPVILIIESSGNIHDHGMIRDCTGFRVDSVEAALDLSKVILMPAPHRTPS